MSRHTLVIGSRGSQLALWQAEFVRSMLMKKRYMCEVKVFKTKGDQFKDKALHEIGGKGVFVKELEVALSRNEADLAVHSLKDLPAITREPFALPAVLKRHAVEDALILREHLTGELTETKLISRKDVTQLAPLKIGTGSLRRKSLLAQASEDFETLSIRGNVDSRLKRLKEGEWDAIVLAKASLDRLYGPKKVPHYILDPDWFVPCAAQGALAIETLTNHPVQEVLVTINDVQSETCVDIERRVLALLGGDCNLPVGVWARFEDEHLRVSASVLSLTGQEARVDNTFPKSNSPSDCAQQVFDRLVKYGAQEIIDQVPRDS